MGGQMNLLAPAAGKTRAILADMSHSLLSTTPTAEKPALSEEQRAQRLRALAERLRRPDGLDRDALKQIEKLTGDEQQ